MLHMQRVLLRYMMGFIGGTGPCHRDTHRVGAMYELDTVTLVETNYDEQHGKWMVA